MRSMLEKASVLGVLDYGMLMSCLSSYKAPHRKITGLLRSKVLIRIKKGLYILGDELRRDPINLYLIANLLYGPSYVSQEFALQYYGLIPERVETVTSMTSKRHKQFDTPLGFFSYEYCNLKRFAVGVDRLSIGGGVSALIASPEKAIADVLKKERNIKTRDEMLIHLTENLRVDEDDLRVLDQKRLQKIVAQYRQPAVSLFYQVIKRGV